MTTEMHGPGFDAAAIPEVGSLLAGKYRVERIVASGGMGVVLEAHHRGLEKRVAIKLMLANWVSQPTWRARFESEARAAASLTNNHVVRVTDIDRMHNGTPFMVMELLQGESLEQVVSSRGASPLWQAVTWLLHACEGLAEAHARGIIHRDIKPSNLFLAEQSHGIPCLKVLDFGISKILPQGPLGAYCGMTAPSFMIGTKEYMAPEQWGAADRADQRTDIWALGVVLLELLTGIRRTEYPALSPPPRLRTVRADAPAQVEALISACLSREASGRPADVLAFAQALAPHGDDTADASVERIAHLLGKHANSGVRAERSYVQDPPPACAAPGEAPRSSVAVLRTVAATEPEATFGSAAVDISACTVPPQAELAPNPRIESSERAKETRRRDPEPKRGREYRERLQPPHPALATFDELDASMSWPADADEEAELIEGLVARTKIFVCDTFLVRPSAQRFLVKRLLPALERHEEAKLILPKRVFEELRECARGKDAAGMAAARAISTLNEFMLRKRLDLRGEKNEIAGQNAGTRDLFMRIVFQYQIRYELTFLTASEDLARMLSAANQSRAIQVAKPVRVLSVDDERGLLLPWIRGEEVPQFDTRNQQEQLDVWRLPRGARIFIDTCSLMIPDGVSFLRDRLVPVLGSEDRKLLVPERVLCELEKNARVVPDLEAREAARLAHQLLQELSRRGVADVRRDDHEVMGAQNFADPLFIRLFIQHQKSLPLVLITQDRGLATQVLENARLLEAGPMSPTVSFISEGHKVPRGALGNWIPRLAMTQRRVPRERPMAGEPRDRREYAQPFALAQHVYRGSTDVLPVSMIPAVGDTVRAPRAGRVHLVKELAEGGEGTIYETSIPNVVCKVYFAERVTEDRRRKLEKMVTRPAPAPTICWPMELVQNDRGEFVGYLMPRAQGEVLNDVVFMPLVLKETFPSWGRRELVQLAIETLSLIRCLHDLNIIIGDINQNNFMVTEDGAVYLVDTDSFQIEEFPCPVGTVLFTPPELMGCTYAEILRTKEHELFAVATLVFMILLLGKPPYSGQEGGDIEECIKQQRFPYVKVEGERSRRPFGTYKFIWSHLPKTLKDDFIEIFAEGSRIPQPDSSRRGQRPHGSYVDRLIYDLRAYGQMIERGRSINDLMPTELWLRNDQEIVVLDCETSGCTRKVKMVGTWYEEMLAKKQRALCPLHDEVRRLRMAEPSRSRRRPERGDYDRAPRRTPAAAQQRAAQQRAAPSHHRPSRARDPFSEPPTLLPSIRKDRSGQWLTAGVVLAFLILISLLAR